MQLSKKGKTVLKFFASFLKFPSHFEHFSKKDDPHFKGNIYKIFWEAYSFQCGMQLLMWGEKFVDMVGECSSKLGTRIAIPQ